MRWAFVDGRDKPGHDALMAPSATSRFLPHNSQRDKSAQLLCEKQKLWYIGLVGEPGLKVGPANER
jgi:hypothetical protein